MMHSPGGGSGSGSVDAIWAIHLPRLRLMRSNPGVPSWASSAHEQRAPDSDLLDLAVLAEGNNQPIASDAPVLIVPLADGRAQDREDTQRERAFPDGTGIPKRLIRPGTGQSGDEVLGAGALSTLRQHVALTSLSRAAPTTLSVLMD
jgi:hypothetical protein